MQICFENVNESDAWGAGTDLSIIQRYTGVLYWAEHSTQTRVLNL